MYMMHGNYTQEQYEQHPNEDCYGEIRYASPQERRETTSVQSTKTILFPTTEIRRDSLHH